MTYLEFIQNIINTRGQWNIPANTCYEAHHIVPKCLGGLPTGYIHTKKHENIIWLYPQEHYEAHKLLALENPNNAALVAAWVAISQLTLTVNNYTVNVSAEDYAKLKILDAAAKSIRYSGTNNPNYGKKASAETRMLISKQLKNSSGVKNSPRFANHCYIEATKEKIKQKLQGRFWITNNIIELFVDARTIIPTGFRLGRLRSDESLAREELFRNKILDDRPGVKKAVYCIELNKKFETAAEASRQLGIDRRKISACCHGKRNTTGGYHWQYCNTETIKVVSCIETGDIYKTLAEAEITTGINRSHISSCCNNKRKTAGGYHWEYINIGADEYGRQ